MLALGLMSGTSMDGIDVALLETDGGHALAFGPSRSFAYAEDDRALLRDALRDASTMTDRAARPGVLTRAEARITALHVEAVRAFRDEHREATRGVDVVGFHGQTVLHRPERRLTVQIGDGDALARALGIAVVADLRGADVAAGGQGAPLVPAYHRALALSAGLPRPAVLVNIGGVANVTILPAGDADPVACDTGPGNALLDDLMLDRTGVAVDRDGAAAARGAVDRAALAKLLDHPYFALPPPKSLDRNDWSRAPIDHLGTDDAAATLTEFTAETVALAIGAFASQPRIVVVCGGGARNPTLMSRLAAHLSCAVRTADALGWDADAIEAQAFAYLAVRSRLGLPLTFPGTTGVGAPLTGGVFHPPR